ncbi:MAG: peptidoglycan-binding protein, partial [Oscillospiraceae bacterium]
GLTPDGIVDFRTWDLIQRVYNDIRNNLPEGYAGSTAALYPGYNLTPGMRNDDVREFQTYLRVVGENIAQIPVVDVTGYFGEQTENAVRIFQQLYGIPVSGVVNAPTWDSVAKEYNYIRFGTQRP